MPEKAEEKALRAETARLKAELAACRAALKAREASEERYRFVAEMSADYAYQYRVEEDGDLSIEWIAGEFERITGFEEAQLLDVHLWRAIIHPEDLPLLVHRRKALHEGEADTITFRITTAQGEERWLRDHAQPVRDPATGRIDRIYGIVRDVTESMRAEENIRHLKTFYEEVLDSVPVQLAVFDLESRLVYASATALPDPRHRREVVGQTPLEACEAWGIDAGTAERRMEMIERSGREWLSLRLIETLRDEMGRRRQFVRFFNPVVDAKGRMVQVLTYALDVTDQRRAEAETAGLKAFYENVLHKLPIEVAVFDEDARYLYLNHASMRDEEMRAWMMGRTCIDYARRRGRDPKTFEERYLWLQEAVRGREQRRLEETIRDERGRPTHMLRVVSPIEGPKGEVQLLGYGIDITERKLFEKQILVAKEEAEEMNRLKSAFLANMSHEIRTPLTAVIGFAAVLAEEIEGEHRELAQLIEQGGQRLLHTINSVLDLSMLEAGSINLNWERVNLVEVVRENVYLLRTLAEAKGLTLEMKAADPLVLAEVDEACLGRILNNLTGNAIKFTEKGGIMIEVSREGSTAVLRVSDTGVGISSEFLPNLFDEFKQESMGLQRAYEGSGLGLAITKRLVDLMDGTISVESRKGFGSTFIVRLPIRRAAAVISEADAADALRNAIA